MDENPYNRFFSFFGLRENPFAVSPDPRYLFMTRQVKEAWDAIAYGVRLREGIIVLAGEAGTGKTSIIQRLLEWLRERRMPSAFIFNSHLEPKHLYDFMLSDFEVQPDARWQDNALARLHEWLIHRANEGQIPVLIVDEAQGLSAEVLEEIRMLLNLETPNQKLLQVILVGQLELDARLNRPEMRQLKQRVTLRCKTSPLSLKETQDYVQARLDIAGAGGKPIFSPAAVNAVHSCSRGIPRVMNLLCEHALINAYAANVRVVPERVIDEIAREFHFERDRHVPLTASPAEVVAPQNVPSAPEPPLPEPTLAPMPLMQGAAAAAVGSLHKVLPFSDFPASVHSSSGSGFSDAFDEVLATAARVQASARAVESATSVQRSKDDPISETPSHLAVVRKRSDRLRLAYHRAIKKLRARSARPIFSLRLRADLYRKKRRFRRNVQQACEKFVNAPIWDRIASAVSRYASLAAERASASVSKANQRLRLASQVLNSAAWKRMGALRNWLAKPSGLRPVGSTSKEFAIDAASHAMKTLHATSQRTRQREASRFYAAWLPKGQTSVNVVVLRWLRQPFNPSRVTSWGSRAASTRNR